MYLYIFLLSLGYLVSESPCLIKDMLKKYNKILVLVLNNTADNKNIPKAYLFNVLVPGSTDNSYNKKNAKDGEDDLDLSSLSSLDSSYFL